jgi:hypothetical protein
VAGPQTGRASSDAARVGEGGGSRWQYSTLGAIGRAVALSSRVSDWVRQSQGSWLGPNLLGLLGQRELEWGGKERGDRLGWGGPSPGEKSGLRGKFGPKGLGEIRNPFSFSNIFYKFQTNLNLSQI